MLKTGGATTTTEPVDDTPVCPETDGGRQAEKTPTCTETNDGHSGHRKLKAKFSLKSQLKTDNYNILRELAKFKSTVRFLAKFCMPEEDEERG